MVEPSGPTPASRPMVIVIAVLFFVVLAPIGFVCSWWNQSPDLVWALLRDPREYPHTDDPVHITKGDGNLEKDLLPHFLVKLSCDANGLRYGEWEDFGPDGWLALRFDTSQRCLRNFVRDNGLQPSRDRFPLHRVPEEYEWHIDPGNVTYAAQPSGRVRLTVSVDSRSARPIVYVFSTYH